MDARERFVAAIIRRNKFSMIMVNWYGRNVESNLNKYEKDSIENVKWGKPSIIWRGHTNVYY